MTTNFKLSAVNFVVGLVILTGASGTSCLGPGTGPIPNVNPGSYSGRCSAYSAQGTWLSKTYSSDPSRLPAKLYYSSDCLFVLDGCARGLPSPEISLTSGDFSVQLEKFQNQTGGGFIVPQPCPWTGSLSCNYSISKASNSPLGVMKLRCTRPDESEFSEEFDQMGEL